jgi:exodeoxyribonuclease VII small subunit
VTIEEDLARLDEITQRLESDGLELEEAIGLFDEGLELASAIKSRLEEAKLKIEKVLEKTKDTFSLESLDRP